ncbi:MAG: hypothetical protein RBJ76_21615 [Stenomitos frigidus ULC029]
MTTFYRLPVVNAAFLLARIGLVRVDRGVVIVQQHKRRLYKCPN